MSDVVIKLVDRMSDKSIKKQRYWPRESAGQTALHWAFYHNIPDVVIKLIDKMSDEVINIQYENLLCFIKKNNMKEIEIKLKDRRAKI